MKFIDHFLEDRKHSLAFSIDRLEQLKKEGADEIIISMHKSSIEANSKIINAFELHGSYLNLINEKHWWKIMPKLYDAVDRYERRKISATGKKHKDPATIIRQHIGHAQKVLDDLALSSGNIYSDDGKTFITPGREVREVAPSAVDRVLLGNLLYRYIEDLESKTFRIAHRGQYYALLPISKDDIEKVLSDISKEYFHSSKEYATERKQLKDTI